MICDHAAPPPPLPPLPFFFVPTSSPGKAPINNAQDGANEKTMAGRGKLYFMYTFRGSLSLFLRQSHGQHFGYVFRHASGQTCTMTSHQRYSPHITLSHDPTEANNQTNNLKRTSDAEVTIARKRVFYYSPKEFHISFINYMANILCAPEGLMTSENLILHTHIHTHTSAYVNPAYKANLCLNDSFIKCSLLLCKCT